MKNLKIISFVTSIFILASCGQSAVESSNSEKAKFKVSWKNYDGTVLEVDNNVEEGTLPTYDGVAPVKPRSSNYTYTFSGWSPLVTTVKGDATYYAQYADSVNSYAITWKNYDGSVLKTTSVKYGSTPSFGGTPTRELDATHYYSFAKWNPTIVKVTCNTSYIAEYTQHDSSSFIISFDGNGGSGVPSSQTKSKGISLTLGTSIPTYENHTFVGWNSIYENKVYQAGSSFELDSNVTLYAMWEDTCEHCNGTGTYSWTKTCSHCDGTGKIRKCNSCSSYSIKQVVGQGYSYYQCNNCNGISISNSTCTWCNGKGSSINYENCTYCNHKGHHGGDAPTASSIEARTVILNPNSGYEYSKDGINFQNSPIFDNLKPHTSYSFYQRIATNGKKPFGCTSKPLSSSTKDAEIYFVEYVLNGGVNSTQNPSSYSTSGSSIKLNNPTREHYDFVSWTWTYDNSTVTSILPSWNVDAVLVANWKATGYKISYNLNGGSASNPTTHGVESAAITLNNPTRIGCTFKGWTGSNGTIPSTSVKIEAGNTDNLSYTANWSLNTYHITYNLNGGINNKENPSTYNVEFPDITLKNPSREHYVFAGWKDGSSKITWINPKNAKDYVLTATWTPINYSISYDLNGGTGVNPTTHSAESDSITLANPTKNGYTFDGWTGSNGSVTSNNVIIEAGNTDNLSYTANWSLNTYSITYILYGGKNALKNPSTYTTEDTITLSDASKDYYSFAGWYKEAEFINKVESINGQYGDLTLYAKFIPFEFKSTFNSKGGMLISDNALNVTLDYSGFYENLTISVHNGNALNPYLYSHDNNRSDNKGDSMFVGWYLDTDCTQIVGESLVIEKDITLYSKWEKKTGYTLQETKYNACGSYNVPYNCNGSLELKVYASSAVHNNENGMSQVIVKNLTTKTTICQARVYGNEKVFDETLSVKVSPGDSIDIYISVSKVGLTPLGTAYATVTAINRIDCFVTMSTASTSTNSSYEADIIAPSVSRKGYDFIGWHDENDELIHDIWDYTEDKNFHAEWSIHSYNISYNLNGGINSSLNPSIYNLNDTIVLKEPTRNGYSFNGWYTDSSFTNRIEVINGSECTDYNLYAKWIANEYVATLDYGGGQNCPKIEFYSSNSLIRTTVLYKDSTLGYFVPETNNASLVFAGWYTDSNFIYNFDFSGIVSANLKLYAKWVSVSGAYSQLGSNCDATIEGKTEKYIEIVPTYSQTITVASVSDLDLYGAIYDENMNLISSSDDISDENLNFSLSITLQAGKKYYIMYRANQVGTNGNATISINGVQNQDTQIIGEYTEVIESVNVTYGAAFSLPNPYKQGFEFVGWFDENGNLIDVTTWNYSSNSTIYAHWKVI
jgi:uncharacterized repeat protein (TIGR02543 family)